MGCVDSSESTAGVQHKWVVPHDIRECRIDVYGISCEVYEC